MKPITFTSKRFIPTTSIDISNQIADMARWEEFTGYGFLPGIKSATYETRTDSMIGSRIRVQNLDGSTHVEEIYTWNPEKEIGMKLHEFSPPLNKLASHFNENWLFEPEKDGTQVSRSFELFPKSSFTKPFLWLISRFFRRAIDKHLADMAESV